MNSSNAKSVKIVEDFDKVRPPESIKVGTFLRHSVYKGDMAFGPL